LNNSQYLKELESCGVDLNLMRQNKRQTTLTSDKKNVELGGVYRKLNTD
jgi:hypothetical protein